MNPANGIEWRRCFPSSTESSKRFRYSCLPETAVRLYCPVVMKNAGEWFTVTLGDMVCTVTAIDDEDNPGLRIDADEDSSFTYRYRPPYSKWAVDDSERDEYRKLFSELPDWRTEPVILTIDITPTVYRIWIQGRWVASQRYTGTQPVEIHLETAPETEPAGINSVPLQADPSLLPLDLAQYTNASSDSNMRGAISSDDSCVFAYLPSDMATQCIDLDQTVFRNRNAYVSCPSTCREPGRALFRIPPGMYDRVHILCSCDGSAEGCRREAFRFIKTGRGHAVTAEFQISEDNAVSSGNAADDTGLHSVTVPLSPCEFQDFLSDEALDVEACRPISRDDVLYPHPSDVLTGLRIHAVTLERAPVSMTVTSEQTGHIFELPEQPRFEVNLHNGTTEKRDVELIVDTTDSYGATACQEYPVELSGGEVRSVGVSLPQDVLGRFALRVLLRDVPTGRTLERRTTFALLPTDTRTAKEDSPFGIWCFFEGHDGVPADIAAPLFKKVGARWTLASFVANKSEDDQQQVVEKLAEYDVHLTCANVAFIGNTGTDGSADITAWIEKMHRMPLVERWLVFWETFISREHRGEFPPDVLGAEPRPLTDEEQTVLDNIWDKSIDYARRAKEEFPGISLIYGNGHPAFLGTLMARGYPEEFIDGFGLDFDMFLSMPELQPGPLYAPFASLYFLTRFQKIYGYENKPRLLTEAIYSPEMDGWLTERQQADYYVRSHLLGIASGVIHFGMATELYDPGDLYYYSHYGPVGLCHMPPELNPRESLCAYAEMTRVLDGKQFRRMLPTPSHSLFALEFSENDGDSVYAFWTIRGTRNLHIQADGPCPVLTDMFANSSALERIGDEWIVPVSSSPVYVEELGNVKDIAASDPVHHPIPDETRCLVSAREIAAWQSESAPDPWCEELGRFNGGSLTVPYSRQSISLSLNGDETVDIHMEPDDLWQNLGVGYQVHRPGEPVSIPGRPRALGMNTCGNSSWSRVVFEVTDVRGNIWRSVQSDQYVDFDGERYTEVLLPWPADTEILEATGLDAWRTESDAEEPVYPVAFSALIVECRTHVIRGVELEPVPDGTFTIGDVLIRNEE